MRVVKVFIPLRGVTALRPTVITINKSTDKSRLKHIGKEEEEFVDTEDLNEYLVKVTMEERNDDEKVGNNTDITTTELNKNEAVSDSLNGYGNEEYYFKAAKPSYSQDDDQTNESRSSRCTSGKSTKTVKTVRFALPSDANERKNLGSRGSSICEPFFGIRKEPHQHVTGPQRPDSGWSITSSLGEHPIGYGLSSQMKNRGSMTAAKQIPGRFFPRPTTLDEKRRALQESLRQSKKSRVRSAPAIPNRDSLSESDVKSLKTTRSYGMISNRNDMFRTKSSGSPLLRRNTKTEHQVQSGNTFWEQYESKTDTFTISFRETDTPTYDFSYLGKSYKQVPSRLPSPVQYSKPKGTNFNRSDSVANRQSSSNRLFEGLEGTCKTLHKK